MLENFNFVTNMKQKKQRGFCRKRWRKLKIAILFIPFQKFCFGDAERKRKRKEKLW